jgi:hypothetical protein
MLSEKNTPKKFYRELMFVRDFLYSNNFLSVAQTFSTFQIRYDHGSWSSFMNTKGIYDLDNVYCHCHADSACQTKAGFFGNDLYNINKINNVYAYFDVVDEWYIGCVSPLGRLTPIFILFHFKQL